LSRFVTPHSVEGSKFLSICGCECACASHISTLHVCLVMK
jgi:hypothetical protein